MSLKYQHLVGRNWDYGNEDCLDIGRCFFRDNHDIHIDNYARPNEWWVDPGWNLYEELALEAGFVKVNRTFAEAWPSDISLVCVIYPQPCHAVVHLGGRMILHHPIGRFSVAHNAPHWVRKGWDCTMRHRDLPQTRDDEAGTFNLIDALSARKQALLKGLLESHGRT